MLLGKRGRRNAGQLAEPGQNGGELCGNGQVHVTNVVDLKEIKKFKKTIQLIKQLGKVVGLQYSLTNIRLVTTLLLFKEF